MKGYEVFVLTKDQYMDLTNKGEYTVYVISDDDDKMIWKGQIVGNLMMETGTVIESRQGEYRPVRKPREEKKAAGSTTVGEYAQVVFAGSYYCRMRSFATLASLGDWYNIVKNSGK